MLRTVEKDYLHSVFSSALHSKSLAKLSILFSIYSLNFLHWYLVASFTLSWFITHCSSFLKGFSPSPVCPHQYNAPSNNSQREGSKMQIWCHSLLNTVYWLYTTCISSSQTRLLKHTLKIRHTAFSVYVPADQSGMKSVVYKMPFLGESMFSSTVLAAHFYWEFLPNINIFSYAGFYFSLLLLPLTVYSPTITTTYKYYDTVVCPEYLLSPPICPETLLHSSKTISDITFPRNPLSVFQED